jgi:hypothetical protein
MVPGLDYRLGIRARRVEGMCRIRLPRPAGKPMPKIEKTSYCLRFSPPPESFRGRRDTAGKRFGGLGLERAFVRVRLRPGV